MLTIKNKYLYQNGKRFFYFADTCWSAFTNIEESDWQYYLDTRKSQGFNAIQIDILRQWDSAVPLPGREPFAIKEHENGTYEFDFTKINNDYFDNAVEMLKEMEKRNMVPGLVLLWSNYIPGAWMSGDSKNNIMPFKQIKPYISFVINKFKKFNPVWFISGDVGFTDNGKQKPEEAIRYYREVLKVAKETDPKGIFVFHTNGASHDTPEEFVKQAGFYSYQSGHVYTDQETAYQIPQILRNSQNYEGPIIDTELCYEGVNQMFTSTPRRYNAYDVRQAAWRAVLSGADAGLGYGAFGLWPWKDVGRSDSLKGKFVDVQMEPYDWRDCLHFRGAEDIGLLKKLILKYAIDGLEPISNLVKDDPRIRGAKNDKYILIYLPNADSFDFNNLHLEVKECQVMDLNKRSFKEGKIKENILQMLPITEDELIIVKK